MIRRALIALCASTCLLANASSAAAYEYGSNFGIADINTPGIEQAPAFAPATKAIWTGTCDLASADTSEGGTGSAPVARPHCIDFGSDPATVGAEPPGAPALNWIPGGAPTWRLKPVTQAGAHPDGSVYFRLRRAPAEGEGAPDGNVKDVVAKLPLGVVANPEIVPKCLAIVAQDVPPGCLPESQVGIATLALESSIPTRTYPFYVIEARDTVTAELTIAGVIVANIPVTARGRTNSDYGVDTLALLIPTAIPALGSAVTVWGTPWSEEHDKFRVDSAEYLTPSELDNGIPETGLTPAEGAESYEPSWGPIKPFFTNPTSCSAGSPTLTIEADSWQNPTAKGGPWVSASAEAPPVTGCEKLEFDPEIELSPTTATADSPAGLDVHLSSPQNNDPPSSIPGNPDLAHDPAEDTGAPAYWKTDAGLGTAHLRDTVVKLPVGTSFNPAAANGLKGCTIAQIGLTGLNPTTFNNDPVQCPEESKLGTLQINTPLLPDPLFGDVYATPQGDNPYPGSLTSIYLVSQDEERGLSIKLSGKVDLDPRTGQIGTTFVDNPQLPFDDFILHLKTGPRAPLNTPAVCGQFENASDFVAWSFPDSGLLPTFHDPFDIASMPNGLQCVSEPEDRTFGPGFSAGSTSQQAGAHTSFIANVTRDDGHQEISSLSFQMPPGLTANLSSTPACSDAALASISSKTGLAESQSPACPSASQLGAVDTLAGAGPTPLPTSGKLYLAGPYDPDGGGPKPRAPLSVAGVVPAIAGGTPSDPAFDLGNVVVRSATYLDPKTAQVKVDPTPLPYIVGGVPLRVRRISVQITKPDFMLNPTNCSEMSVGAGIGGAADPLDPNDDISTNRSSRFQVGGCENLGFKPKLALKLKGSTKRTKFPALVATLTPRPGDANIARTAVTLPRTAFLEQAHIRTICTRVQFAANSCPSGSIYGKATAYSPLLNEPLSGNVYLRSSDNDLPDMVAALKGPESLPIEVELVGRIDSVKGGIRSTFDVVPDAPVSKFVLQMQGGKKGLIVNSRNLCAVKRSRAIVRFAAQNGRTLNVKPVVGNDCGKARRGGKKGGRGKRKGR